MTVYPASSVSVFKATRRPRTDWNSNIQTEESHDERSSLSQEHALHNSTSAETSPVIVKFGTSERNPVCLQLQPNGTGFVRWSKAGAIACSLENGRLFASYSSGAIAVVLDSEGNGSISSPDGKNLLTIRNNSATVYETSGVFMRNIPRSVESRDFIPANSESSGGEEGKVDKINGGNGDILYSGDNECCSWMFDGMGIDFDPETWEVRVTVDNDRLSCEFSRSPFFVHLIINFQNFDVLIFIFAALPVVVF